MPIKVLVVDDSAFFRRRIKDILEKNSELKVIGFADNGQAAVEKVKSLSPDVVTMDYEMPFMDGISAVRHIMADKPTPILMFSSLSYEGARVTLDALEAGAVDYLPKSFESMSADAGMSAKLLQDKVLTVAKSRYQPSSSASLATIKTHESSASSVKGAPISETRESNISVISPPVEPLTQTKLPAINSERFRLVVIGASTGGPVALQSILTNLPESFPCPILLVQHMPGTFTSAFAERLDRICRIRVKEARDNDEIKPGQALLAPGGMQMLVNENGKNVSIVEGNNKIQYRPSVDVTFGSAARSIKGKILAVVLTGMGNDGREGCKLLKKNNATVWTQDEKSCVVYGMPMVVAKAGLSDAVMDINDLANNLKELH